MSLRADAGIRLLVFPQAEPLSWERFQRESEPFSVAIDGYVFGPPQFEPKGPRLNLNHHEGVSRLETRATCEQALIAVRQGLFRTFSLGAPHAWVYANDCDEDVCLTWYVLSHGFISANVMNPVLNRLVTMEGLLDTTAGAYAFPAELQSFEELNWVFAPYRHFRSTGGIDRRKGDEFSEVIVDVGDRIDLLLAGKGRRVPLDTSFKRLGGGHGWDLVRETGSNARIGLFNDGITAFVSVRERADGRFAYSIGRQSHFIPFDVLGILDELNRHEPVESGRWGGSTTIGGSPRAKGSALSPPVVTEIIEEFLEHGPSPRQALAA